MADKYGKHICMRAGAAYCIRGIGAGGMEYSDIQRKCQSLGDDKAVCADLYFLGVYRAVMSASVLAAVCMCKACGNVSVCGSICDGNIFCGNSGTA